MGISPPLGHLKQNGDLVQPIKMYLLYLDESGTHSSARNFVLAGVAVLETNVNWAADHSDRIQLHDIELPGTIPNQAIQLLREQDCAHGRWR